MKYKPSFACLSKNQEVDVKRSGLRIQPMHSISDNKQEKNLANRTKCS